MIIVLKFTGMFQWLIQSYTCSIVFQRPAFQNKQQQQKQNKHTQTHTQHKTKQKQDKQKTNKSQIQTLSLLKFLIRWGGIVQRS